MPIVGLLKLPSKFIFSFGFFLPMDSFIQQMVTEHPLCAKPYTGSWAPQVPAELRVQLGDLSAGNDNGMVMVG